MHLPLTENSHFDPGLHKNIKNREEKMLRSREIRPLRP